MDVIKKIEVFDKNVYWNTGEGANYQMKTPKSVLWSAYSPDDPTTLTPVLALKKALAPVTKPDGTNVPVYYHLTVQCMSDGFFKDVDNKGNIRTTANFAPKPHGALADNGTGSKYVQIVPTVCELNGKVEHSGGIKVHVHDHCMSPDRDVTAIGDALRAQGQLTADKRSNQFPVSYMYDPQGKQILVTQHCLLKPSDYQLVQDMCDKTPNLNQPAQLANQANSPINTQIGSFCAIQAIAPEKIKLLEQAFTQDPEDRRNKQVTPVKFGSPAASSAAVPAEPRAAAPAEISSYQSFKDLLKNSNHTLEQLIAAPQEERKQLLSDINISNVAGEPKQWVLKSGKSKTEGPAKNTAGVDVLNNIQSLPADSHFEALVGLCVENGDREPLAQAKSNLERAQGTANQTNQKAIHNKIEAIDEALEKIDRIDSKPPQP